MRSQLAAPASKTVSRADCNHLFDHLVGTDEERLRDCESKRFGGPEVDHQLELGRLFDRKVGGFHAPEDAIHLIGTAAEQTRIVRSIRQKPTRIDEFPVGV